MAHACARPNRRDTSEASRQRVDAEESPLGTAGSAREGPAHNTDGEWSPDQRDLCTPANVDPDGAMLGKRRRENTKKTAPMRQVERRSPQHLATQP